MGPITFFSWMVCVFLPLFIGIAHHPVDILIGVPMYFIAYAIEKNDLFAFRSLRIYLKVLRMCTILSTMKSIFMWRGVTISPTPQPSLKPK
jgi:type IV secretory pathway VirB3-like protein